MTRSQIHQAFVSEFHSGDRGVPLTDDEIDNVERELATVLPESYLSFIRLHGAVHTPSLLSLVVDCDSELWDVQEFLKPQEVIEHTQMYWSGGMSDTLVGFASDSMGNMFCFSRTQPGTARPKDASVWFFDHEFCDDISQLAESFDDWLFSYLKLKRT